MLKLVNEARTEGRRSQEEIFGGLVSELKKINTNLNKLSPKAIGKILKIYCDDQGLDYNKVFSDLDNLDVEEFAEWFDLSGDTGNFIFDFARGKGNKLTMPAETVIELILLDPRLSRVVRDFAIKHQLITPDGREITSRDPNAEERGRKVDLYTICRWVLVDLNSSPDERRNPEKDDEGKTDLTSYSDKDIIDIDLYNDTIDRLEKLYKQPVKESLNEAEEQEDEVKVTETEVEPIPAPEEVAEKEDIEVEEVETSEDDDAIKVAVKDLVNQLMTDTWAFISKINSGVTTIKYSFKDDEKEDLLEILNGAADDATIIVGMLSKASSLLDDRALKFMLKGEEKAEKLIR